MNRMIGWGKRKERLWLVVGLSLPYKHPVHPFFILSSSQKLSRPSRLKFNTKTQTSRAGSFDRVHILDCPQRYRR
ncbi:MAG TPA: hypothetical protein PLJ56_06660, partial [Rectinema sp.]|nr:hypothetical protein [Rectinema sp.]